jgi:hypothetical protein
VRGTVCGQSLLPESSSVVTTRSLVVASFGPESVPPDEEELVSVVVDEQPDAVTVVMSPAIAETLASANNFLVTITRLLELNFLELFLRRS